MGGLTRVYNRTRGSENVGGDIENTPLAAFYNNSFASYDLHKLTTYSDILTTSCLQPESKPNSSSLVPPYRLLSGDDCEKSKPENERREGGEEDRRR
jgi:hypothetical protein